MEQIKFDKEKSESILQGLTKNIMDMVSRRKEELLFNRLLHHGKTIDFDIEKERRFKKIIMERNGNEETYYYNDGSIEGLRIITFILEPMAINGYDTDNLIITNYY